MKYFIALVVLTATIFAGTGTAALGKTGGDAKPEVIPGKYIVVFKDDVSEPASAGAELAARHGLAIDYVYENAIKGFAGTVPLARLEALKQDSRVAYVTEDAVVSAFGKPVSVVSSPAQKIPTGISRLGTSAYTGSGVGVAIIDTGIDLTHPDLAANIMANTSCVTGKKSGSDDNGHGTHVAGTIAALRNTIGAVGVAPEAKLIAVKVLNAQGSGTWSSIICGIDWVTANAAKYNIKVANMSLGGSGVSDNNCGLTNNDAMHQAICASRNAGVTYVVAAGNSAADASTSVPAAYDDAVITVSALADSDGLSGGFGVATSYGADDTFASFSNYGSVVDLGAPGVNIFSTWKDGGYNTISGTSMAAPHVSGAAALYLQKYPTATWTEVRDGLRASGEALGSGHQDLTQLFPEPVVQVTTF